MEKYSAGKEGLVMSRDGFIVAVVICGGRDRVKGYARVNLDILEKSGRRVEELNPCGDESAKRVGSFAAGADMVVDGLFGTGLKGELGDEYKRLIGAINGLDCPILAVDIPSGLDCDSGKPHGAAIRADYTVTFVAAKKGFTVGQAAEYTGEIFVASIGVQPSK
jgi:NAD(P)H-hydrate epimerase